MRSHLLRVVAYIRFRCVCTVGATKRTASRGTEDAASSRLAAHVCKNGPFRNEAIYEFSSWDMQDKISRDERGTISYFEVPPHTAASNSKIIVSLVCLAKTTTSHSPLIPASSYFQLGTWERVVLAQ